MSELFQSDSGFTLQWVLEKLAIEIKNKELLKLALTHKSFANEDKAVATRDLAPEKHNERLEFLGDAILGMFVSHELYRHFPHFSEGQLSKLKAQIVCEPTLAEIGNRLQLGSLLSMGKGEAITGGRNRNSIIANSVEAIIGALYLSNGYQETEKLIAYLFEPYLRGDVILTSSIDFKSQLQEYLIETKKIRPVYQVTATFGPEHEKQFEVSLFVKDTKVAMAVGSSKKKAEQLAAEAYWRQLHPSSK